MRRHSQNGCLIALLLILLLLLLLAGCKEKKSLPFYQFEVGKKSVLTVDGVRYIQASDVIGIPAYSPGCWSFTGEVGSEIGICGGDNAEEGGGNNVCEIVGDEEHSFLYVLPNHFVFGPYYTYFCARENLQLTPPSAETVSYTQMTLTIGEKEEELADSEVISALLDFYFEGTGDAVSYYAADEDMTALTLIFHHRDYPFLTARIQGCQQIETGASYLTCQDGIRRELSAELAERLSIEI